MLKMNVEVDPKMAATIARFKFKSDLIMGAEIGTLVRSAAKAAKTEARTHLKDLVYTAPLPPSAYTFGRTPATYLAMDSGGYRGRRTGRVFKSVKTRSVAENIADMYVDPSNPAAYYYAWIMNFGGSTINYPTLPFFSITVKVMRARFYGMGGVTLKGIKADLLGFTNPAVAEAVTLDQ